VAMGYEAAMRLHGNRMEPVRHVCGVRTEAVRGWYD